MWLLCTDINVHMQIISNCYVCLYMRTFVIMGVPAGRPAMLDNFQFVAYINHNSQNTTPNVWFKMWYFLCIRVYCLLYITNCRSFTVYHILPWWHAANTQTNIDTTLMWSVHGCAHGCHTKRQCVFKWTTRNKAYDTFVFQTLISATTYTTQKHLKKHNEIITNHA